MNTYVVWVEMDRAKIFRISDSEKSSRVLHRHEIKHHTSSDPKNHKDCEKFFHQIADALKDADEILLAGPSPTKEHFKAHLERHHHAGLAKKIVATRNLPWLNDERLMEKSQEFFRLYDLYGQSLTA